MRFCQFCGREIPEGQNICECQKDAQNPVQVVQNDGSDSQTQYTTSNGKVFAILSYIGILFIIGLLVTPEKDDPKVRFHVGQGMILAIANVAVGIILSVFGLFLPSVLSALLRILTSICVLLLAVIGIINSCNGEEKPLPVIGQLAFYK